MSKHFGEVRQELVSLDFWLIVSPGQKEQYPRRPSARITAGYPSLARYERAINLKVNLPLALFEAPQITARIDVAAPDQPVTIDASAIADAVRGVIGMDIDIAVTNPGEGE